MDQTIMCYETVKYILDCSKIWQTLLFCDSEKVLTAWSQ